MLCKKGKNRFCIHVVKRGFFCCGLFQYAFGHLFERAVQKRAQHEHRDQFARADRAEPDGNLATIEKFGVFMDLTGDFGVVNNKGYAISLRPGVAWMATEHWTAAFRFAFLQYDHGMYPDVNGVYLDFKTVAPSFGLYYNF